MNIDVVFRIAAIGMLVAVLNAVLSRAGREDIAALSTIAGLAIVLFMVAELVGSLFERVRDIFDIY